MIVGSQVVEPVRVSRGLGEAFSSGTTRARALEAALGVPVLTGRVTGVGEDALDGLEAAVADAAPSVRMFETIARDRALAAGGDWTRIAPGTLFNTLPTIAGASEDIARQVHGQLVRAQHYIADAERFTSYAGRAGEIISGVGSALSSAGRMLSGPSAVAAFTQALATASITGIAGGITAAAGIVATVVGFLASLFSDPPPSKPVGELLKTLGAGNDDLQLLDLWDEVTAWEGSDDPGPLFATPYSDGALTGTPRTGLVWCMVEHNTEHPDRFGAQGADHEIWACHRDYLHRRYMGPACASVFTSTGIPHEPASCSEMLYSRAVNGRAVYGRLCMYLAVAKLWNALRSGGSATGVGLPRFTGTGFGNDRLVEAYVWWMRETTGAMAGALLSALGVTSDGTIRFPLIEYRHVWIIPQSAWHTDESDPARRAIPSVATPVAIGDDAINQSNLNVEGRKVRQVPLAVWEYALGLLPNPRVLFPGGDLGRYNIDGLVRNIGIGPGSPAYLREPRRSTGPMPLSPAETAMALRVRFGVANAAEIAALDQRRLVAYASARGSSSRSPWLALGVGAGLGLGAWAIVKAISRSRSRS